MLRLVYKRCSRITSSRSVRSDWIGTPYSVVFLGCPERLHPNCGCEKFDDVTRSDKHTWEGIIARGSELY